MRDLRRAALGIAALAALAAALGSREAPRRDAAPEPAGSAAAAADPVADRSRALAWTGPARGSAAGRAARAAAVARSRRAQRAARRALERARVEPAIESARLEVGASLLLDPPEPAAELPVLRVAGFDPVAPRPVWLWRVGEAGVALAARGRSRADGELVFPRLAIPADGLRLVATPAGVDPGDPRASQPRDVPGRPARPRARVPESEVEAAIEEAIGEGEGNHADPSPY